ncbi:glycine-rich domain-containing protein [Streptomyces sp. NPDC017056]|uniref:glycine-rich domain-containing protein n=1 Tax=Streptomyces sp. NPDC017056 TaxID=3364973 RepID=UPI0037A62F16
MKNVRELISAAAHVSIVSTVKDNNPGMDVTTAVRITDEGLKFVTACAATPDAALAPSRVVDEGWHALILHTSVYAELCDSLGRRVHHYPGYAPGNYDPAILERTQDAIRAAGYDVDADLWGPPGGAELVTVAAQCQHSPPDDGPTKPMPAPRPPCRDKP